MNKSTVAFSAIALVLLVFIGFGLWMLINRQDNQDRGTPQDTVVEQQTKTFTMDEIAFHNSKTDCWAVISGEVYDLTDYINRHPGGSEIVRACGTDATSLFNSRQTEDGKSVGSGTPHSKAAREQLDKLKIGTLAKD